MRGRLSSAFSGRNGLMQVTDGNLAFLTESVGFSGAPLWIIARSLEACARELRVCRRGAHGAEWTCHDLEIGFKNQWFRRGLAVVAGMPQRRGKSTEIG
jgi:hypothetical protein